MRKLTTSFALAAAVLGAGMFAPTANAGEATETKFSYNAGVTTNYVFRGFSQSSEKAAVQGGIDVTRGIFYAGIWASSLRFGKDGTTGASIADAEIDFYAGIKPVWHGITFDLGMIYYGYPNAKDKRATNFATGELDYYEFKFGMSREIWKDATLSGTYYISPDYTNNTGTTFTSETQFTQEFAKFRDITPSFSALLGYQRGVNERYAALVGNGDKNYWYWNAGMTFTRDKLSLDLRYWDTSIANNKLTTDFCKSSTFQCDAQFLATLKYTY